MLFTDGLVESNDGAGVEYGLERVRSLVHEHRSLSARELVAACVADLGTFQGSSAPTDDPIATPIPLTIWVANKSRRVRRWTEAVSVPDGRLLIMLNVSSRIWMM